MDIGQNIVFDRAGFPMVWIEEVKVFIHWLPVTKIQFETFICDFPNPRFGDDWYSEILLLNQRTSAKSVKPNNYWQLFITGILPGEIDEYLEWCQGDGHSYSLPTNTEWSQIYRTLSSNPSQEDIFRETRLKPRVSNIITKMNELLGSGIYANTSFSLADQMLMRFGVMEWVKNNELHAQEWVGMGLPVSSFHSIMRRADGPPHIPRNPNQNRLPYYGFRLLRK